MAVIKQIILFIVNKFTLQYPRTNDWFLVRSPMPVIFILAVYFIFVKDVGVKFMSTREPFKLDKLQVIYNLTQIISNVWIIIAVFSSILTLNPLCSPIDYSNDPHSLKLATYTWFYYMLKIVDLLDTVFFVLRKKESHASFLHVYHHSVMVFVGWFGTKYAAGGHSAYLGYINAIVHAFMYTYYLLTNLDRFKNNLWWKKHITQLQLAQFTLLSFLFAGPLFDQSCGFPKMLTLIFVPQNALMTFMFADFYYKTYIKKKVPQK